MERLTEPRIEDGRVKLKNGNADLFNAMDKLWFYENTGLDPNEADSLAKTFRMISESIQIVSKTHKGNEG